MFVSPSWYSPSKFRGWPSGHGSLAHLISSIENEQFLTCSELQIPAEASEKTELNEGVEPEIHSTCRDICSETEHRRVLNVVMTPDSVLMLLGGVWERSHFSGSGLRGMWPEEEAEMAEQDRAGAVCQDCYVWNQCLNQESDMWVSG